MGRVRTGLLVLVLSAVVSACASVSPQGPAPTAWSSAQSQHAIAPPSRAAISPPSGVGRYKVGAPYKSGGVWYVPAEQPDYNEVGLASWYGDAFDGKPTANGEIFDMRAPSAAHATLPMPCLVEVTNLDNGRVMTVRMNDRGPFHPGRIIDLSHAAAEQLGFAAKGTARVRVRYAGPAPLSGGATPLAAGLTLTASAPVMAPPHPIPTYQIAPPPMPARFAATAAEGSRPAVQVGAFSTRSAAERVAARLAPAGQARIESLDRGGATLYRVVVRPTDAATPDQARSRVAALGFGDARVLAGS